MEKQPIIEQDKHTLQAGFRSTYNNPTTGIK